MRPRSIGAALLAALGLSGCGVGQGAGEQSTEDLIQAIALAQTEYLLLDLASGGLTTTTQVRDLGTNPTYRDQVMVFKAIEAGLAVQGSAGSDFGHQADETASAGSIPRYYIGVFEVTQAQWRAVMGSNPSRFSQCGDDCPVEQVGWIDAQEFARRLSQKTGKDYRLPSESEWEYAARAGSTTKWSFGDNGNQLGDYAWYGANSQYKTQRVAQKRSNAFGLYDMHGNVWEWVEDCWHGNYSGAPIDGSAWSTACSSTTRVLRGGSWIIYPTDLRSAVRHSSWPDSRSGDSGLRLARTP